MQRAYQKKQKRKPSATSLIQPYIASANDRLKNYILKMKNKWKEYKMAPCTTESTLQSAEVKAEKEMLLAIRKTCEMSVFLDMLEQHRAPTLGLDIMHISPLSYIADAQVSWQLYPKGAITL